MTPEPRVVKVGTRRSRLARAQTTTVRNLIEDRLGVKTEEVLVTSEGDVDRTRPLAELTREGPGLFTRALEAALRDGRIDVAIHSFKDMPLAEPEDIPVVAILPRAPPADVLVVREDAFDADAGVLPVRPGARVGSSSPRRQVLTLFHHPEAVPVDVRGNVDTRLGLIGKNVVDGVLLARAGLDRGQFPIPDGCRVVELPVDAWPTAPAQGALAVQARVDDPIAFALTQLDERVTRACVTAERNVLQRLGGGCGLPLGATVQWENGVWWFHGAYAQDGWWSKPRPALRTVNAFGRSPGTMPRTVTQALTTGDLAEREADEDAPRDRLAGTRVLVTFDDAQAQPYVDLLERHGAHAAAWPVTAHEPLGTDEVPAAVADAATRAQWVVVASARGVPGAAAVAPAAKGARYAAVGPGTARAMRAAGLPVHLVAPDGTARSLAETIIGWTKPEGPVLAPGAEAPRPELAEMLGAAGFDVVPWPVYRTRDATAPAPALDLPVDALVVTAPSAARALPNPASVQALAKRIIAFGPSTAKALTDRGFPVAAEAPRRSPEGVLEALLP